MLASLLLVTTLAAGGLTADDVDELRIINALFVEAEKLEEKGAPVLTEQGKQALLARASGIAGEELDRERLEELSTTFWGRVTGFFTFINIIWVTAAVIGVIAIMWLFGIYFLQLIISIPAQVWEVAIWLACIGLVTLGLRSTDQTYALWYVFPACLGMIGAMILSHHIHIKPVIQKRRRYDEDEDISPHAFVLGAIWALVAILFDSQLIGFISVGAFMTAAGFFAGMYPMCICLGFQKEDNGIVATVIAGAVWVLYLVLGLCCPDLPEYQPFVPGLAFLGTFCYFLGLLIISNKWYLKYVYNALDHYVPLQVVVVISGIAALYFGTAIGSAAVVGVGGTFFYIWLLQKYFEIVATARIHAAWAMLFLAGILYFMAWHASKNPEYFIFMANN